MVCCGVVFTRRNLCLKCDQTKADIRKEQQKKKQQGHGGTRVSTHTGQVEYNKNNNVNNGHE